MLSGIYADPFHLIEGVDLAGLRFVGNDGSVVGCDDGKTWWSLSGSVDGDFVEIDFSPKAPKVGKLKAKITDGLEFPDGNKWVKTTPTTDLLSKKNGLYYATANGKTIYENGAVE